MQVSRLPACRKSLRDSAASAPIFGSLAEKKIRRAKQGEAEMTETTTQQTETPAAPAAKPKAYRVNLLAKSGLKRMKIEAHPRREGVKFYVEIETRGADKTDKKGKLIRGKVTGRDRGAFATFKDMALAQAHADAVAETAKKAGWAPVERKGGFAPKPEVFTLANLPKP
jgi:hypothetical protein